MIDNLAGEKARIDIGGQCHAADTKETHTKRWDFLVMNTKFVIDIFLSKTLTRLIM